MPGACCSGPRLRGRSSGAIPIEGSEPRGNGVLQYVGKFPTLRKKKTLLEAVEQNVRSTVAPVGREGSSEGTL